VVATGLGVVTSVGAGKSENWTKLSAGRSGIHTISRFCTEHLRTRIAGTVDFLPVEPLSTPSLSERLGAVAGEEAVAQARIGRKGDFPGPLFLGVPPIEIEWPQRRALAQASGTADITYDDLLRVAAGETFRPLYSRFKYDSVADALANMFGTKGSPISLTTACASGASAIQLAVEAIRRGESDAALVIGADGSVNQEALIRFSLLSALSTANEPPKAAAKPFSKDRDGFIMAEGAAALVLESYDAAKGRGAAIAGVIEGCGEMADSYHRTRTRPGAGPITGCIRNALDDAGLGSEDIDYINAHGTGTLENDKMECLGITSVFGERARSVPISSNKSMIGHTMSAAGAIEAVFTFLTLEHQRLLPTINYRIPDPMLVFDVVPNQARDATVRHALSNSLGFGGQNVSLVMAREPA